MLIREQLEQVSRPGTDPLKQAAVITWAMQYQGAYYHTRRGGLRRVFPKATETVIFNGVTQSPSAKAIAANFTKGPVMFRGAPDSESKGDNDAADQPQADPHRA